MLLKDLYPILTEALSSTYPYELTGDPNTGYVATFEPATPNDGERRFIEVELNFDSSDDPLDTLVVGFQEAAYSDEKDGISRTTKLTGKGDQFKVLATVIKIMADIVAKHSPKYIEFWAKGDSRTKLYKNLAARFLPPEYDLNIQRSATDWTIFSATRKDLDEAKKKQ